MPSRDKYTICFVDDDPLELVRFERAFANNFKVVTAGTYSEAISKLRKAGRRSPDLWVLDLYFPNQGVNNSPKELHEMSARFESFDRARREFLTYLHSTGQGNGGGLALLARCKEDHRAPVVMFTRKGTIDDAIVCLSAGAAEVLKKPMPPVLPKQNGARVKALDDALIQASNALADRFATQIRKNTHWAKNRARYIAVATFLLGLLVDRALGWMGL